MAHRNKFAIYNEIIDLKKKKKFRAQSQAKYRIILFVLLEKFSKFNQKM